MFKSSFAICLIAGLALLAGGCGSTKKAPEAAATTTIASTNTGATGSAGEGAQGPTQSAGVTHAPHTTGAKPENGQAPAQATPEQSAPKTRVQPVKPGVGSNEITPPHHYPKFIELDFIASCEAAKGSSSSCECILGKQEKSNVEKGQSIAELVGLEVAFKEGATLEKVAHHGVQVPSGVKRAAEQCAK